MRNGHKKFRRLQAQLDEQGVNTNIKRIGKSWYEVHVNFTIKKKYRLRESANNYLLRLHKQHCPMDQKVIFVGIHNKAGKMPLCGSTKTGKIITDIIASLPQVKFIRTNLINDEAIPLEADEIQLHGLEWLQTHEPVKNDIIVLLGAFTHKHFPSVPCKVIKAAHPSSNRGREKISEYVVKTSERISKAINNSKAIK